MNKSYPFLGIVGQEDLKKAIIITLINPKVKGVLISGEKGTGKSTISRSIKALDKELNFIELPLNATEDMVFGGIDFESTIKQGKAKLSKGIISKANKGVIYVDEINLIDSNISNALLDSMESGIVNIQREGFQYKGYSNFSLIGTMNPEEGKLSPQILDRFALSVKVSGELDFNKRKEIIKRRIKFEENKLEFINRFSKDTEKLIEKIEKCKKNLSKVAVDEEALETVWKICRQAFSDGYRAEYYIVEAAKALAVYDSRAYININDINEASLLVLPHRKKEGENNKDNKSPSNDKDKREEKQEPSEENKKGKAKADKEKNKKLNNGEDENSNSPMENNLDNSFNEKEESISDKLSYPENGIKLKNLDWSQRDRKKRFGDGKRNISKSRDNRGRYTGSETRQGDIWKDIAIDTTIRMAAPHQIHRNKNNLAIKIEKQDIRNKRREVRTGSHIVFLVDASGSMGANKRMKEVKTAILSLLQKSYEDRDKVSMISFHHNQGQVLLPFTRSMDLCHKMLIEMKTGGRTPLAEGLFKALKVFKREKKKEESIVPLLVIITDGRANYSSFSEDNPIEDAYRIGRKILEEEIKTIVIDTEDDFISFEIAKELSRVMEAKYYKIDDLKAKSIERIVKANNSRVSRRIEYT